MSLVLIGGEYLDQCLAGIDATASEASAVMLALADALDSHLESPSVHWPVMGRRTEFVVKPPGVGIAVVLSTEGMDLGSVLYVFCHRRSA